MTNPRKKILWMQSVFGEEERSKQKALEEANCSVSTVSNLKALRDILAQDKFPIILVSAEWDRKTNREIIIGARSIPELWGARFILLIHNADAAISELAACLNFRDLVPKDLGLDEWVGRILYSSSGKDLSILEAKERLAVTSPAHLELPARLIWLSGEHVQLECAIQPEKGSRLVLNGNLVQRLGLSQIPITIENVKEEMLSYRFSIALTGRWPSANPIPEDRLKLLLEKAQEMAPLDRYRVFLAVKNGPTRKVLTRFFNHGPFLYNAALFVKNLAFEAKYFTPDLIIIDAEFCLGNYRPIFDKLLWQLKTQTRIIIYDPQNIAQGALGTSSKPYIYFLSSLDDESLDTFLRKHLFTMVKAPKSADPKAVFLDPQSDLSFATIQCPAVITSLHSHAIELTLATKIKKFALGRVRSELIETMIPQAPWVKFTTLEKDASLQYQAKGFFVDLSHQQKRSLGSGLAQRFDSEMAHFSFTVRPSSEMENPLPSAIVPEIAPVPTKKLEFPPSSFEETVQHQMQAPEPRTVEALELPRKTRPMERGINKSLKYFIIFAVLTIVVLTILAITLPMFSENVERPGEIYTKQLLKFMQKMRGE